jgi:hypothetical protein
MDMKLFDPEDLFAQPRRGYPPPLLSAWRRRPYQIAVALGAVAVLGAGTFAALEWKGRTTRHTAGPSGDVPTANGFAPESGVPGGPGASAAPPESPAPGSSPGAPPPPGRAQAPATRPTDVKVSNSGHVNKDKKTLRVVTAHGDLTGQQELAWVADAGQPVGEAHCTQNFKIGQDAKPRERPTMMICWRTSATKSVYTVSIDLTKKPSAADSVAAINKAWAQMG